MIYAIIISALVGSAFGANDTSDWYERYQKLQYCKLRAIHEEAIEKLTAITTESEKVGPNEEWQELDFTRTRETRKRDESDNRIQALNNRVKRLKRTFVCVDDPKLELEVYRDHISIRTERPSSTIRKVVAQFHADRAKFEDTPKPLGKWMFTRPSDNAKTWEFIPLGGSSDIPDPQVDLTLHYRDTESCIIHLEDEIVQRIRSTKKCAHVSRNMKFQRVANPRHFRRQNTLMFACEKLDHPDPIALRVFENKMMLMGEIEKKWVHLTSFENISGSAELGLFDLLPLTQNGSYFKPTKMGKIGSGKAYECRPKPEKIFNDSPAWNHLYHDLKFCSLNLTTEMQQKIHKFTGRKDTTIVFQRITNRSVAKRYNEAILFQETTNPFNIRLCVCEDKLVLMLHMYSKKNGRKFNFILDTFERTERTCLQDRKHYEDDDRMSRLLLDFDYPEYYFEPLQAGYKDAPREISAPQKASQQTSFKQTEPTPEVKPVTTDAPLDFPVGDESEWSSMKDDHDDGSWQSQDCGGTDDEKRPHKPQRVKQENDDSANSTTNIPETVEIPEQLESKMADVPKAQVPEILVLEAPQNIDQESKPMKQPDLEEPSQSTAKNMVLVDSDEISDAGSDWVIENAQGQEQALESDIVEVDQSTHVHGEIDIDDQLAYFSAYNEF